MVQTLQCIHSIKRVLTWIRYNKSIILIEVLLLSMYPYALYCFFDFRSIGNFLILFAFFCSVALFVKKHAKIRNDVLTKYVGFMCIFNLLYGILHQDSSYLTRIIISLTAYFFIYSLIENNRFRSFIRANTIIITVQAVLAGIAFMLFMLGIISQLSSFVSVDNRECFSFGISFSNIILPPIARMSGYFDEPGALAFWGIYALLFNELYIKNKILEYCLIIGLLSTLSMAYFIQLAMYIMFFKITRLRTFLSFAIIFIIIGLNTIKIQSNSELYKLTIERFERAGSGNTSRTELTDLAYGYFIQSPVFGHGAKNIEAKEYIGDNPYELPAKDGIVGTFFTYLPLLLLFCGCKSIKVKFAIIILIAGYLQRPFHINLMHYMMLYSFFIVCDSKYGNKRFKLNYKLC